MPRSMPTSSPASPQRPGRNPARAGRRSRRGVTLVEMLVVVALVILMMTILVTIFASATGAISVSRRLSELDSTLRNLDGSIRRDLSGITAKMTPPNDPKDGRGYFEYGENAWSDPQGEDTDDYLAFTAKAPDGQPFTGRFWVEVSVPGTFTTTGVPVPSNIAIQPITVTSNYAEIIYFLRNGNLYRRVLLIAPERQGAVYAVGGGTSGLNSSGLIKGFPSLSNPGGFTSFLGSNDLSARPVSASPLSNPPPLLNSLGDLTNRENRYARPRFTNDYRNIGGSGSSVTNGSSDLVADDFNNDNVNDYYPTLFPNLFSPSGTGAVVLPNESPTFISGFSRLNPFTSSYSGGSLNYDAYAFPYIYPYAYSKPDLTPVRNAAGTLVANKQLGWIHGAQYSFPGNAPSGLNHHPLDFGDNLDTAYGFAPGTGAPFPQSFWGFPTWRETSSYVWRDPTWRLNQSSSSLGQQAPGLRPSDPSYTAGTSGTAIPTAFQYNFLPPLNPQVLVASGARNAFPVALTAGPLPAAIADDSSGSTTFVVPYIDSGSTTLGTSNVFAVAHNPLNPNLLWEDDLVASGVRSFDIKAYDSGDNAYRDLGSPYRDDGATTADAGTSPSATPVPLTIFWMPPFLNTSTGAPLIPLTDQGNQSTGHPYGVVGGLNPSSLPNSGTDLYGNPYPNPVYVNALLSTFAHEGRIPPLYNDFRMDAQTNLYPAHNLAYREVAGGTTYPAASTSVSTIRLRRVFDTWSTDYTTAPLSDINLNGNSPLYPLQPPFYPSYPPPYPAGLRGIKIKLRLVDPGNERVRTLTITQDFTDRL